MRKLAIFMILSLIFAVAPVTNASPLYSVTKIYDGDTITLSNGMKVRLLQIDTPELSPAECYGKDARQALIKLIDQSKITLCSKAASITFTILTSLRNRRSTQTAFISPFTYLALSL